MRPPDYEIIFSSLVGGAMLAGALLQINLVVLAPPMVFDQDTTTCGETKAHCQDSNINSIGLVTKLTKCRHHVYLCVRTSEPRRNNTWLVVRRRYEEDTFCSCWSEQQHHQHFLYCCKNNIKLFCFLSKPHTIMMSMNILCSPTPQEQQ